MRMTGKEYNKEQLEQTEKSKQKVHKRPYYRGPYSSNNGNRKSRNAKKFTWYKVNKEDSKFKTVIFVEATEGDELVKIFEELEEKYRVSDDIRINFFFKKPHEDKGYLT